MGSPGGGVGGASGSGAGGSGGVGGDSGGSGGSVGGDGNGSDGNAGSGVGSSSGGNASAGSDGGSSAGNGSGSADSGGSFDGAMSAAAENSSQNDGKSSSAASGQDAATGGMVDAAGQALGGQLDVSTDDDDSADQAAQNAARASHHANEFDGLGATGGPLSGQDSFNSHRGYGLDDSLAGAIDQDVNAGLTAETPGSFDRPAALDDAGYAAAGAAGGFAVAGQHANVKGINTVADTLGRHPTANLPTHPGSTISNAEYAAGLRGQKTAADALAAHPAKSGAMRGILEDAASAASRYGRTATGIGLAFDPVVSGTAAAVNTEGDWTEKATAAVIEGAKRADNVAVSGVIGFGAASLTMGATAGMGTLAAPATGAVAGVAAGEAYARTPMDPAFDGLVESARPGVQATFEAVDSAVDTVVDFASSVVDALSDDEPTDLDMMIAP